MEEQILVPGEAFTKNQDGSWTSLRPTDIQAPIGSIRIPSGMTFRAGKTLNGVNVVEALERTASTD